jgi:hypothetical protein
MPNIVSSALKRPSSALRYAMQRYLGIKAADYRSWEQRGYDAPSPPFVKRACIRRNGLQGATWIETGTYRGDTTRFLADFASRVYSIEPEPTLFANAARRFKDFANVEIINGLSENVFPDLLPTLRGDVCFWLDGHFSAGVTHKGPQDTPILDELKSIGENLSNIGRAVVLVDDVRCLNPDLPEYSTYPSLDVVVDWCRRHDLSWHIEHDILVAKRR